MSGLLVSPQISQSGFDYAHGNGTRGSGPKEHPQDKKARTAIEVAGKSPSLQAVQ